MSDEETGPGSTTEKPRGRLRDALPTDLVAGILFAVAIAWLMPRLGEPPTYVFDEVYHAYTAAQYVAGNHDAYVWYTTAPRDGVASTWNHPPAGLLVMAASIRIWGDNAIGWRFGSAVFGAAGVVLTYLLALATTRRRLVAVVAASLLLIDGLYFVQSRVGMLDVYGTVFMLAALLAFHRYLTAPPDRIAGSLLAVGGFLGLAIATKWNAGYPALLIGVGVLVRAALAGARGGDTGRRALVTHLVWVPVALAVVPAAVYLAAYVPFFSTGHGFAEFVELQKQTFYYHTHLTASHAYQSRWWEWPLTARPVWYYSAAVDGRVANLYANGNTALYLAFVPAVLLLLVGWVRRREPAALVLAVGFLGQWLPWALVPRIAFAYHFLPAVPFGCLAVAAAWVRAFEGGRARRAAAVAYLTIAVAFFLYFYPIYATVPLTRSSFESRMWFPSWR